MDSRTSPPLPSFAKLDPSILHEGEVGRLPHEILDTVIAEVAAAAEDPCIRIKELCTMNKLFGERCKTDALWRELSKACGFLNDIRWQNEWHQIKFKTTSFFDPEMLHKSWFAYSCRLVHTRVTLAYECFKLKKFGRYVDSERYGPINTWNTSRVGDMSGLFNRCTWFDEYIGDWDVSQVEDMMSMFQGAAAFNQDIGKWNVSRVRGTESMFKNASSFEKDIGEWNTPNLETAVSMFENAISFNSDLSSWNVEKLTYMIDMFKGATSFNSDLRDWQVSPNTDMTGMFEGATAFNADPRTGKPTVA